MDSTDIKILNCLKENSRENASVIGQKVNMSVSAVIERIKKLENSGIIKKYTIILDPKRINKDVMAYISVSIEHPKYNESFINFVKSNKNIIEGNYITGDFDFILKACAESTQMLEKILNEIKSVQGVSLTRTLIILSSIKNDYSASP